MKQDEAKAKYAEIEAKAKKVIDDMKKVRGMVKFEHVEEITDTITLKAGEICVEIERAQQKRNKEKRYKEETFARVYVGDTLAKGGEIPQTLYNQGFEVLSGLSRCGRLQD